MAQPPETCPGCGEPIEPGQNVAFVSGKTYHLKCAPHDNPPHNGGEKKDKPERRVRPPTPRRRRPRRPR